MGSSIIGIIASTMTFPDLCLSSCQWVWKYGLQSRFQVFSVTGKALAVWATIGVPGLISLVIEASSACIIAIINIHVASISSFQSSSLICGPKIADKTAAMVLASSVREYGGQCAMWRSRFYRSKRPFSGGLLLILWSDPGHCVNIMRVEKRRKYEVNNDSSVIHLYITQTEIIFGTLC